MSDRRSPSRKPLGLIATAMAGYLIGAFPTADIAARLARRGVDLRSVGSGNPGALNAAKELGSRWGLIVMGGDMLKGAIAGLTGRAGAGGSGAYLAATGAVLGHCFPPWSRFRGGKGVATSHGTTFTCFPPYAPVDLTVAASAFFLSKGQPSLKTGPDSQPAARIGTYAASAAFCAATVLWWARRLPNLWGPKPTIGLPLYAFTTSAIIALRFLTSPPPPDTSPDAEPADRKELSRVP